MIFLLFFLMLFTLQTFMNFIVQSYTYQHTIAQLYIHERKKESIMYAISHHLAKILTKNYDQKNQNIIQEEQLVEFHPIAFSDNRYLKIHVLITLKNNMYDMVLTGKCSEGEKITYHVTIVPQKDKYILKKFQRMYV